MKRIFLLIVVWGFTSFLVADEKKTNQQANFIEVTEAISKTMKLYHYDPSVLKSTEYTMLEQKVSALAKTVQSREEFVAGFNQLWQQGPFSHVVLTITQQSAEQMANYLDSMKVGGGGAVLSWNNDIAILTVNTMMGLDTIEEIQAAYQTLQKRQPKALIIDLRKNGGGAFAVKPLVSHVIHKPLDAGVFLSQHWTQHNKEIPTSKEIQSVSPWQGWSIKAFWEDVQTNAITRVLLEPTEPNFSGPVYVLVSQRTASAAEMAADALLASGRATLIGESTAGKMLSQKMYDLPHNFQLFLPIADYYATHSGRIEGTGVKPHIAIEASQAMQKALSLINQ